MKYTPENVEIILSVLRQGKYRIDACEAAGISYTTFQEWYDGRAGGRESEPKDGFVAAVKEAEREGLEKFRRKHLHKIDEIASLKITDIRNTGVILGACQWLLERRLPKEFGARTHQEISGYIERGDSEATRKERERKVLSHLQDILDAVKTAPAPVEPEIAVLK